jgi:thymidylate synthase
LDGHARVIFRRVFEMIKPVYIEEKTLDSMWFALLSKIYDFGRINNIDSGSFAGSKRLEFDYVSGVIQYPTTRPLAPILPEGIPPVTTDEDIEKYFVSYLMDGKNLADNEHYRYATWITGGKYKMPHIDTEWFGGRNQVVLKAPNQLQWCIDHYKQKGFGNNHCTIQVGYPESNMAYDLPYKNEAERGTSPCLRLIDTKIVEDDGLQKLCFMVVFRSWDLWGAFPENMGGIVMLMEYMANELGIEVGSLAFSCLKLHCYDFELDVLKARLGKN